MAEILPDSRYDEVRAAIDVTLTHNNLPDSIISAEIYKGAAEDDVVERVATAQSIVDTGTDADSIKRIRRSAILFCAARLIPATVQITSISTTVRDMSISRPAWNTEKRVKELKDRAIEELQEVTGYSTVVETKQYSIVTPTRVDAWSA